MPRGRATRSTAGLLLAVLVAACAPFGKGPADGSASSSTTAGSPVTPTSSGAADDCPAPPGASTGPAAPLVEVHVELDHGARPGGAVSVSTRLRVSADGPRIVVQPQRSGLVVLRDGRVVARATSPESAQIPFALRAGTDRPAQAVPDRLTLVGCDGAPLVTGSYTVRAVVGYGDDPLNAGAAGAGGSFALVSEPAALTIS